MTFPAVISEAETLERAHAGASLARFGDGELKLALGHTCVSQKADPRLARELREILAAGSGPCLPCLPNLHRNAKPAAWGAYDRKAYSDLMGPGPFGSAFITRPDSAPWIDIPEYWARVEALWACKTVTLVVGTDRSLRPDMLDGAYAVRVVRDTASHRDAYDRIDEIEDRIGLPTGPVLLCLGATATVLAWRLAKRGVHALDLGHIGMFMRHAGAYRYTLDDLVSPAYRAQLVAMHQRRWGADGAKHLAPVLAYADAVEAETVLDYGCGEAKLSEAAKPVRRILNFDPGIQGRDGMPKPVDLVVATDVLEHVEPEKLDAVLDHIHRLAGKAAYMVIATRPAKAVLPDGRNAHLIQQPPQWWIDKLTALGWTVGDAQIRDGRDLTLRLAK